MSNNIITNVEHVVNFMSDIYVFVSTIFWKSFNAFLAPKIKHLHRKKYCGVLKIVISLDFSSRTI